MDDRVPSKDSTIVRRTIVSRSGAAVRVTRLDLSPKGQNMLKSSSAGMFTKSERDEISQGKTKTFAAA